MGLTTTFKEGIAMHVPRYRDHWSGRYMYRVMSDRSVSVSTYWKIFLGPCMLPVISKLTALSSDH